MLKPGTLLVVKVSDQIVVYPNFEDSGKWLSPGDWVMLLPSTLIQTQAYLCPVLTSLGLGLITDTIRYMKHANGVIEEVET